MKKLPSILAAIALVACVASVSTAETWTLSGLQAAMEPNPNGAWSYGVYLEDSLESTYGPYVNWSTGGDWPGGNLRYYGNPGYDLSGGAIFYANSSGDRYVESVHQWLLSGQVAIFSAGFSHSYTPFVR
jgi:hypothetical protein